VCADDCTLVFVVHASEVRNSRFVPRYAWQWAELRRAPDAARGTQFLTQKYGEQSNAHSARLKPKTDLTGAYNEHTCKDRKTFIRPNTNQPIRGPHSHTHRAEALVGNN